MNFQSDLTVENVPELISSDWMAYKFNTKLKWHFRYGLSGLII